MSKIEIALRSKSFWSLVGIFILSGLNAVVPSLNGVTLHIVQGVLAVVTVYFHPQELQIAGTTGMLGSTHI